MKDKIEITDNTSRLIAADFAEEHGDKEVARVLRDIPSPYLVYKGKIYHPNHIFQWNTPKGNKFIRRIGKQLTLGRKISLDVPTAYPKRDSKIVYYEYFFQHKTVIPLPSDASGSNWSFRSYAWSVGFWSAQAFRTGWTAQRYVLIGIRQQENLRYFPEFHVHPLDAVHFDIKYVQPFKE